MNVKTKLCEFQKLCNWTNVLKKKERIQQRASSEQFANNRIHFQITTSFNSTDAFHIFFPCFHRLKTCVQYQLLSWTYKPNFEMEGGTYNLLVCSHTADDYLCLIQIMDTQIGFIISAIFSEWQKDVQLHHSQLSLWISSFWHQKMLCMVCQQA